MTTAGDAAPDRSRSDWIVRLHRDTTEVDADTCARGVDSTVLLAGHVVAHRGHAATNFGAVSIVRRPTNEPLQLTSEVLELRCDSRDLPDSNNAPATADLDHVVHVLCSRFGDPQAIERFMDATRGLINDYTLGREAWLEVLAHPTDNHGGSTDEPIVDDVFVGRYPDVKTWRALHEWDPWKTAVEDFEAEASTIFHLVVAPTINRLAAHR